MNSKIKIVVDNVETISHWLVNLLCEHFEFESFDSEKTYSSKDLYFYNNISNEQALHRSTSWPGKNIADNFFEAYPLHDQCRVDDNNIFHLTARDFMWWQTSHEMSQMGYQNIFFNSGTKKFLLTLMHRQNFHRNKLYNLILNKYHNDSLYSYHAYNKFLEGDVDKTHIKWSLYCNKEWYTQTCFSVVPETYFLGKTFVSEKIYKPLAVGHPFIVCGTKSILKLLKLQGFETFPSVIDESYDDLNDALRFKKIEQELERLFDLFKQNSLFNDKQIADILEHNHHHFFNASYVNNLMKIQILEPILEYYHTS